MPTTDIPTPIDTAHEGLPAKSGSSSYGDCPFCGTKTEQLSFMRSGYGVGEKFWNIRCSNVECYAIGPCAISLEDAAKKWRSRATRSIARAELEDAWTNVKADSTANQ